MSKCCACARTPGPEECFAKAEKACEQFVLTKNDLREIKKRFSDELKKSIANDLPESNVYMCFPSYARVPSRSKQKKSAVAVGVFQELVRVVLVKFSNKGHLEESSTFEIPNAVSRQTDEALFGFIAQCIDSFLDQKGLEPKQVSLGLMVDFFCLPVDIAHGEIVDWPFPGYPGAKGMDVVKMLENALQNINLEIKVGCLVNNAGGTLIALASERRDCYISVIVDAHTNAAYLEDVEYLERLQLNELGFMVINTEWGKFGKHGLLDSFRNKYDVKLDENSRDRGMNLFDKMIGGHYLGELVRQVLVELVDKGLIFQRKNVQRLRQNGTFTCKHLSDIQRASDQDILMIQSILEGAFKIEDPSQHDAEIVRLICETVVRRSANLVASGLAALLVKAMKSRACVAMDGVLSRYHPMYIDTVKKRVKELILTGIHFEIVEIENGGPYGAAILANSLNK